MNTVLAFADDICIIADDPTGLQQAISLARDKLDQLGLKLNAGKCATLHLSGRRPVGTRDTNFYINGTQLKSLGENDAATFLGAQVGFHVVPYQAALADVISVGLKIARSKLAPWQRLDALKTIFYPSTLHHQRMGTFSKSD